MSCGCNDTSLPLQNCDPCQNCPPTNAVNLPPCPPDSEPCEEIVYADCTVYDGPNLPALGILDGDRLTSILTKLHRVLNGLIAPPVPYASHTVCATGTASYCLTYLGLGPVYTSTGAATNSGTTITVGSTTGLQVGMTVEVIAGTGSFPTNTLVTAVPTATTFIVSQAPLVALGGAGTKVKATGKVHTIYNVCVPANTCQSICAFVGSPVVVSGTGTITVNQDCSLSGSIGTTSTTTTTTTAAPSTTTTTTVAPGTTTTTTTAALTTSTTSTTTTAGGPSTSTTTSTTTILYHVALSRCGDPDPNGTYIYFSQLVPLNTFASTPIVQDPVSGIYYKTYGLHVVILPPSTVVNVVSTGLTTCPATTTSTTTSTTTAAPTTTTTTSTTTTTTTVLLNQYAVLEECVSLSISRSADLGTLPPGTGNLNGILYGTVTGLYYKVTGTISSAAAPLVAVEQTNRVVCPGQNAYYLLEPCDSNAAFAIYGEFNYKTTALDLTYDIGDIVQDTVNTSLYYTVTDKSAFDYGYAFAVTVQSTVLTSCPTTTTTTSTTTTTTTQP